MQYFKIMDKIIKTKKALKAKKVVKKAVLSPLSDNNQSKSLPTITNKSKKTVKKIKRVKHLENYGKYGFDKETGLPLKKDGTLNKWYKLDKDKKDKHYIRPIGSPKKLNKDGSVNKQFKDDDKRFIPRSLKYEKQLKDMIPELVKKKVARDMHLKFVEQLNKTNMSIFDIPEFPFHTRPYNFTPIQVKNTLADYATCGDGIEKCCKANGVNYGQFIKLSYLYPDIKAEYVHVQENKAEYLVNECLKIADDNEKDWIEKTTKSGNTYKSADHELVKRSDIKIKLRQWLASKWNKRYQEKQVQEITTKNLNINRNIDGTGEEATNSLVDVISLFSGKK